MTLQTRKPTGLPAWPILLLAGIEKTGKSYASAAASASDLIGRTFWIPIGEDAPDELGAIPGARFEIVEHDGTYRALLGALDECVTELAKDEKPGLIVLDSGTRLWNLLSDEAQAKANHRATEKAKKYKREAPEGDVTIGMDLWNSAKQRWDHVMDCLREHQGPSIVTARLDQTAVVDERGEPTKEKTWKVQAHKSLPFDVGAIVEMPAPGEAVLTGVRSLRVRNANTVRRPLKDFTVEALWREMGLAEQAGTRSHSSSSGSNSVAADDAAATDVERARLALLAEIGDLTAKASTTKEAVAADWFHTHGHAIAETTDLGSLELLRDDLKTRSEMAA
jgi:hypothetical protein